MAQLTQSATYTRTFIMVLSSDHVTLATGLTCTVKLSKAGGAFATAGGTVTEIANGFYQIALATTDTGTLGDLAYFITAATADSFCFVDQVVATASANVNVVQWNGTNVPTPATAGIPDVNAKNIGGQAANLDGNNLLKVDVEDWHAVAISTTVPASSSADFNSTQKTSIGTAVAASAVASVTGDVEGKVLGGGSSTITGTGVRAVDASGNAIAPAATALSNVNWTNTRAGYLDNLQGGSVALESDLIIAYDAVLALGSPAQQTGSAPSWYVGPDNTDIAAIKVQTDKLGFDGSGNVKSNAEAVSDKSGYALSSAGLDAISESDPGPGPATTFVGKINQLWRRYFSKIVKDGNALTIKIYQDDGVTVDTTQDYTSASNVDTVGPAS